MVVGKLQKLISRAVAEYQQRHDLPGIANDLAVLCVFLFFLGIFVTSMYALFVVSILTSMGSSYVVPSIAPVETTNKPCNDDSTTRSINGEKIPLGKKGEDFTPSDGMAPSSQQPLTSSSLRTIPHLHNLVGFRKSYFRGLEHMLFYFFVMVASVVCLISAIPDMTNEVMENILITLAVNVSMLLAIGPHASAMHAIVSATPKPFFQRFPPVETWKYLVLPTCLVCLCTVLKDVVTVVFDMLTFPTTFTTLLLSGAKSEVDSIRLAYVVSLVMRLAKLISLFLLLYYLYIPSMMSLYRIEASLLSAHEETIIPFDRTFGDRAKPTGIDDRKLLSLRDAWRSVTTADRRRILKMIYNILVTGYGTISVGCTAIQVLSWWLPDGRSLDSFIQAVNVL